MSRRSATSTPSSAASRGSNRIDLGKDSDVDFGQKSQTSVSSGGIGITQEITTIGGLQIEGGVSIDVSPLDLEISSNGKDKISIGASAEIPGGLLGVGGGVTIDTNTGQIKGGSISGEVVGFGIEISKNEDGVGVTVSWQIPFSPITFELGFGTKKAVTPEENGGNEPNPKWTPWEPRSGGGWQTKNINPGSAGKRSDGLPNSQEFPKLPFFPEGERCGYNLYGHWKVLDLKTGTLLLANTSTSTLIMKNQTADLPPRGYSLSSVIYESFNFNEKPYTAAYSSSSDSSGKFYYGSWNSDDYDFEIVFVEFWYADISLCLSAFPPRFSPNLPPQIPPPNPPPRKQMDECCRDSIRMLRDLTKVMQVKNVLEGKVQIPGELIAIPPEGKTLPPEILQTYPQMINAILLTVNRHGIDAPITVEIEDTDKTSAGNQEAVYTYNSPGVAMQAALEMLHEIKAAGNARLSIQIGIAFAVTRILKIVAGAGESIREIIRMLGMPFRYDPKKMPLEFNLAGIKKGFGKNSKPKDFSEMSKEELESIIPTLLEGSECDIPVPKFASAESDDIRQMLAKLTIRKEK